MTSEPTSYSLSFLQSSENTSCTLVSAVLLHACTKSEASHFGVHFSMLRCQLSQLASQQLASKEPCCFERSDCSALSHAIDVLMLSATSHTSEANQQPLSFNICLAFLILYIKSILVLCELYLLCSIFFVDIAVETPELRNAVLLLLRPHEATQQSPGMSPFWRRFVGTYRNLGISASEQIATNEERKSFHSTNQHISKYLFFTFFVHLTSSTHSAQTAFMGWGCTTIIRQFKCAFTFLHTFLIVVLWRHLQFARVLSWSFPISSHALFNAVACHWVQQ